MTVATIEGSHYYPFQARSMHVLSSQGSGAISMQQLRRKEQSGFAPHRSTTDRIATLRMILQTRREFRRPTWVAYVYFRAAFDCVNRIPLATAQDQRCTPEVDRSSWGSVYQYSQLCQSRWSSLRLIFDICRGAPRLCCCPRLVFRTSRLDDQSLCSPRLRRCEPGSRSVHRSGLCWRSTSLLWLKCWRFSSF